MVARVSLSSEAFEFVPLGKNEIRLIVLKPGNRADPLICELLHVQREERTGLAAQRYNAISYVWGSESKPCTLFCCKLAKSVEEVTYDSPRPISITASLDEILRYLRSTTHSKLPLWVDAVCIDQNNLRERQEQVLLMRQTFSNANQTFVWLGEDGNDARRAIDCIDIFRKTRSRMAAGNYDPARDLLQRASPHNGRRPWLLRRDHFAYIPERSWRDHGETSKIYFPARGSHGFGSSKR